MLISSVIAKDFKGNLNVFSVFRMLISFGALVVYFLRLSVDKKTAVMIIIGIQIVCLMVYYFTDKPKHSETISSLEEKFSEEWEK